MKNNKWTVAQYSATEVIKELKHEMDMRRKVYFRRVSEGKMTRAEMEKKIELISIALDNVYINANAEDILWHLKQEHRKDERIKMDSEIIHSRLNNDLELDLFKIERPENAK